MSGVGADGCQKRAGSRPPSTPVPDRLDTGRPGQQALTVLAVAWATSGVLCRIARVHKTDPVSAVGNT